MVPENWRHAKSLTTAGILFRVCFTFLHRMRFAAQNLFRKKRKDENFVMGHLKSGLLST